MAAKSNESQIRMLIKSWARTVREKNMAGILAHHTDDFIMFDVPPPLQLKGLAAYKKTWDIFFSYNFGGSGSFNLIALNIIAGDAVAFCHALIKIIGGKVRLTVGLRKVSGKWLITHEHHSAPIQLKQEQ